MQNAKIPKRRLFFRLKKCTLHMYAASERPPKKLQKKKRKKLISGLGVQDLFFPGPKKAPKKFLRFDKISKNLKNDD